MLPNTPFTYSDVILPPRVRWQRRWQHSKDLLDCFKWLFFSLRSVVSWICIGGVFVLLGAFCLYTVAAREIMVGYAHADIRTWTRRLADFKEDAGHWPARLADVRYQRAGSSGRWMIPERDYRDIWNEPLQYRYPGLKNPNGYDIFSKGPDQTEDTEDDIGNWP